MNKMMRKGFTLIELLVVIAVLGILAAVVLVAINPTARIQDARNSGVQSDIGQIGTALEAYFTENNGAYPAAGTTPTTCGTGTTGLCGLVNDDQLKQLPEPPTGRATACDAVYTYVTNGTEAAAYADLEPCGSGEEFYVYWTACGKAVNAGTTAPNTTNVATGVGC
jgi:prepilin-type N-terminal cleavage/methylation domain-containing protein